MKFLILTQYYPPETGAPQNRLESLAKQLSKNDHHVEILTAMPNYPKMEVYPEYKGKKYLVENINGIKVHRSYIFISKKDSVILRLLSYFSFVLSSAFYGRKIKEVDHVICESPPLFLGITGIFLSKRNKAYLIFNVSDLWPESVEKLGIVNNKKLLSLAYKLEAFIYKQSHLVSCQTKGITDSIKSRFPNVKTHWFPNGTDLDVYNNIIPDKSWMITYGLENKKVFIYAGIIGYAQGLEVIVKAASKLGNDSEAAFVIIGDGPEKEKLIQLNKSLNTGVVFISNIPKSSLLPMIATAYGSIIPLKKIPLFEGAIPSKIFDSLSLSVPIILGVQGEAHDLFIENEACGIAYMPEDSNELSKVVKHLCSNPYLRDELGRKGKEYVTNKFNRNDISSSLLNKIIG